MDERFEERLKRYLSGDLPPEEHEEVERELEKLEVYQGLVEAELDKSAARPDAKADQSKTGSRLNPARVLSRAKWRARFQNALTAIGIVLVALVVFSGVTSLFYSLGTPSRMETYRDVVRSTIAVTEPNIMTRSTGLAAGQFLTMHMDGDLVKRVGGADSKLGEWKLTFLLGRAGYPDWYWNSDAPSRAQFMYPAPANDGDKTGTGLSAPDVGWERLEKLPGGTVAEAYVSLDRLYGTNELLHLLEGRNLLPLWFARKRGCSD